MADKIGMCPRCEVPLVSTMVFDRAEFYCMEHGGTFGMFDVPRVDATPELEALSDEYLEEFRTVGSDIIVIQSKVQGCELCDGGEYHHLHPTEEQKAAHKKAINFLRQRAGLEVQG